MDRLIWRATLAFLALPGVIAFAVPLLVFRPKRPPGGFAWPGLVVFAIGTGVLGWCIREFFVTGRGTLAPWAPPRTLVTTGLYRYSRNPMYLGVLGVVAGQALAFQSSALGWYALALAGAFHLRVIWAEEPWLARTHGEAWTRYRASVRRWVGWPAGPVRQFANQTPDERRRS